MNAIILRRVDPARNMRCFYRLDVQPDLFGQWCLIRELGRIGSAGQMRTAPYATAAEAHETLTRQRERKERWGYYSASGHNMAPCSTRRTTTVCDAGTGGAADSTLYTTR